MWLYLAENGHFKRPVSIVLFLEIQHSLWLSGNHVTASKVPCFSVVSSLRRWLSGGGYWGMCALCAVILPDLVCAMALTNFPASGPQIMQSKLRLLGYSAPICFYLASHFSAGSLMWLLWGPLTTAVCVYYKELIAAVGTISPRASRVVEAVADWVTSKRWHPKEFTSDRPGKAAPDLTPKMMDPLPVPKGASELVAAVLRATNFYDVLGVKQNADDDALRRAKRTLSLSTHPDKAGHIPGSAEACKRVLEAAEVLLDAEQRASYDEAIIKAHVLSTYGIEDLADDVYEETGVDITRLKDCECMFAKPPIQFSIAGLYC